MTTRARKIGTVPAATECLQFRRRCASEFSYLLWRAEVHRWPPGELERQWNRLLRQLQGCSPCTPGGCRGLDELCRWWQPKYDYLRGQRLARDIVRFPPERDS